MSSRERILQSLRKAPSPFAAIEKPAAYLPMTPLDDQSPMALRQRFIAEAEKLSCTVDVLNSPVEALARLISLLKEDEAVISWTPEKVPLPNMAEALLQAGIRIANPGDASARVGISGVDAALAATGSLLLMSGAGKYRTASLLPPVHIALVRESQILADFEQWVAQQQTDKLQQFRQSSNIIVISGPSRTADIAMQLILGMHGPAELHILLIADL